MLGGTSVSLGVVSHLAQGFGGFPAPHLQRRGDLVDVLRLTHRGGHLVDVLPRTRPPDWERNLVDVLARSWAYGRGNLVDVLAYRLVFFLGGLGRALGSWRDLVHALGGGLAVGGGHHVDAVGRGRGGAGRGVGRVHGSVLGGGKRLPIASLQGWAGQCGAGTRLGSGRSLLVVHAHQDLEAVAGDDALAPVQGAEPPAVQSLGVALQDGHDVTLPEGQLIWRLRYVVVQRLGQNVLERQERRRVRLLTSMN